MATGQPKSEYEKTHTSIIGTGPDSNLSRYIQDIWTGFKASRQPWEILWEELWRNFLGEYQSSTVWRKETEGVAGKSQAFVKLTALKCNTAHSKLIDVLFSGRDEVPFDLEPIYFNELGLSIDEAKDYAKKAKDKIREHFKDIEFEEIVDTGILELAILGTAVLKGPIIETRKKQRIRMRTVGGIPVNELDQNVQPYEMSEEMENVAVIDHVPIWEYYTDINAKSPQDAIGEIHFQRMLPEKFRQLAYQGGYIRENVLAASRQAADTDPEDKRYIQLGDNYMGVHGVKDKRISCLEFQGLVPVGYLREAGCGNIPEDWDAEEDREAIVVLGGDGTVLKVCLNPLGRRQFFVCPYKKRPHVIYGVGVAEMMRDSQRIINSAIRLIIDNKAISGVGMVAINIDRINTRRTKDLKVYPAKTWYVKGNFAPKEAIDTVSFTDVTQGLRELVEMFERFSDEETGIPKYTSGEQDTFLNKTAAGMSMLMTQANINLKTVLKNVDNYWIEPIVEAYYSLISVMEDTPTIPLKVKAMGSDCLIAKELKMENYMKFMQVTSNPQDAIFMDRVKLMKNIARILETDEVMRSDEEIKDIMKQMTLMGQAPKDLRERVDIDKLYKYMTRLEQAQVLKQLGIEPDMTRKEPITDIAPQGMAVYGGEV